MFLSLFRWCWIRTWHFPATLFALSQTWTVIFVARISTKKVFTCFTLTADTGEGLDTRRPVSVLL